MTDKQKKQQLPVYLMRNDYDKLKALSDAEGLSMNSIVNQLVKTYIRRK